MRSFSLGALLLCSSLVLSAQTDSLDARRSAFDKAVSDEWQYELKESPEAATSYGDYRYNDKWSDNSLSHLPEARRQAEQLARQFEAIDSTGFSEQEVITKQLIIEKYRDTLRDMDLKTYLMPVDQFGGIQIGLPQIVTISPFDSVRHYDDYIARLHKIPEILDRTIEVLKQGMAEKMVPPKYLLEKTVAQCDSIANAAGENNAFSTPIKQFPTAMSAGDKQRLRASILEAVDSQVRPAYVKLSKFIADTYAPAGREQPGVWALPNGDAIYRQAVREQTTTSLDPEAIHQLGLAQVKQIEGEMTAIAQKLGFPDLKAFRATVNANPKLRPASGDQLLQLYRAYISDMKPKLPELFGLLPKAQVEVRPVQPYREQEAAGAEYNPGTPDGSRPGIVYVNTSDATHRSLLDVEATAYHEGVPGHHMQISIAQELTSLPPFRQHAQYNAYVEGWALYAERLGKELGFYRDPYSDYGRLSSDLFRACRLVVDTGVHYKHWTRQQMVDFFHAHSDESEPDLQAEVDRYIAFPAQALSYKLGQLKIIELRERARQKLGEKFDIRAFHDEVLNGGALPLNALETRIDTWIQVRQSGQ